MGQQPIEKIRVQGVHPGAPGLSSAAERARQMDQQVKSLQVELRESVDAANSRIAADGRILDISLDSQTNTVIVKITDRETGEQIRQIPTESAVNITRNIDRLTGILVDQKA